MADAPREADDAGVVAELASGRRVVLMLSPDSSADYQRQSPMKLQEAWRRIWSKRWLVVAVTCAFVGAGVAYALVAEQWYRAQVTLAPAAKQSLPSGLGQLAGVMSLAGLTIPSSGSTEALATLRSRDFVGRFITDHDLLPILFAAKWDSRNRAWRADSRDPPPKLGDAVKFFSEQVLSIAEDRRTGLVELSVKWTDPQLAADWANALVVDINARLRTIAIATSERSIAYLRTQLAGESILPIQRAEGNVLETELQRLTLAKGNEQYAFTVIDPATAPLKRYKPQRTLIVMLAAMVGCVVSLLWALARGNADSAAER